MKAVIHDAGCTSAGLSWAETACPVPGPHDLLVAVGAAGVNRADVLQRQGFYPPPRGASPILGLELAGTVTAVGAEVTRFGVGDRVFGLVDGGAYAESCLLHEDLAMHTPAGWDDAYAAAVPETFFTAGEALTTHGGLRAGEFVLIHAGASGVGTSAIQLARLMGARIAVTVSTEEKAACCKDLGAELCIPYKDVDFVDAATRWSEGQGVHLVLDFIGGAYLERHLDVLRPTGRLVVIGLLGGRRATLDMGKLLAKRLLVKGTVMRSLDPAEKQAIKDRFESRWLPRMETGDPAPVLFEKIPMSRAAQAHAMMEEGRHIGKMVLIRE